MEVYHFHGSHQCKSCVLADEYAYYTIVTYFPEELEAGIITYQSLNYEDSENLDLVRKLNVYGSSIYVIEKWADREEIHNPTFKLWSLVGNKNNFVEYFKHYLEEML
ncbi:MAG: nitrophenyl compound nitroreductase subunit ArsF family protein [Candidatus Methanofastidiosia archaeon]